MSNYQKTFDLGVLRSGC